MEKPFKQPLKLISNRVSRSYQGGLLIDRWQGTSDPQDGARPEEWIASLVEARNNIPIPDEGLSKVKLDDGEIKLIDLIASDPELYLGQNHVKKYGTSMAVLTKALDASVRLSIQVHPTKAFAKEHFRSDYGKTEAWYILGGREIKGERPYVLVGFKPGVSKDKWQQYFEEQDIDGMINALHKFYVKPGDVVLINGGLPHAIGSGCFLIEIQEPTDYTMRIERKTFDGNTLPDKLCHQGLGFGPMLDCFTYDTFSETETYQRCFKTPRVMFQEGDNKIECLIGKADTNCFRMTRLSVSTTISVNDDPFKTCIIVSGAGYIESNGVKIAVKQGDCYFLPADLGELVFVNFDNEAMEIILCYPPE